MKDTSIKTDNFVDIETAVSDVRDAIPSLMTKVAAMRDRLQVTQNKLGDQLGKMDQVKLSAIEKVRIDFQDFEMALRKRLAYVESQVEETVSFRIIKKVIKTHCSDIHRKALSMDTFDCIFSVCLSASFIV